MEGRKVYTFGTQRLEVPQRYEVHKLVGRGAYGLVCSAVDTATGDRVAIKKISGVFDDLIDGKRILRELKLLGFLRHQNVLKLRETFRPKDPEHFNDLYFVTEFMDTDMHMVLKLRSINLLEEHCRYFAYQLLSALHYIHSAGVVHRDLKPANLLTNAECVLKVCDFGLARGIAPHMTEYVVTRWYRPPELLLISDQYTSAIDLWAVGCLTAEFFLRKPLFAGRDYVHQINLITDVLGTPDLNDLACVTAPEAVKYVRSMPAKFPLSFTQVIPGAPPDLTDFVSCLLQYNPEDRLSAKDAMNHPWLKAYFDPGDLITCPQSFKWEYDSKELDEPQLRKLLWAEILSNSGS